MSRYGARLAGVTLVDRMPIPGWVPIRDPRSNTGEPVTIAYVNLRQASGIGVHIDGDRRVIKARLADGGERTLDDDFPDNDTAHHTIGMLLRHLRPDNKATGSPWE